MQFSIIIPLYNKANYVNKSIESVLGQTVTDWELIVVDDGCTDNSASIVEQCIAGDQRCRIIHQDNAGVAVARNKGVEKSNGDYLCFLDADDWWDKKFLEGMSRLISSYPDAGIYACNYIYYKPGKTHIALTASTGYMDYPTVYFEQGSMPITSISVCMRRTVFDEKGGFPCGIKLGEDFLLWSKIALKYKVAFFEEALAYYNNDVPPSLRATRNLYAPEHHMLFQMQSIEKEVGNLIDEHSKQSWSRLLDKLRVGGLLDYWMSEQYHGIAAKELEKVDWSMQDPKIVSLYHIPVWQYKLRCRMLVFGSFVKQELIRIILKNK